MYVCIYIYVCVYTYMYVCVYIYICMCICIMYICMCVYVLCIMYICMCVYVYVNEWFYNILGGIFYSRISRILRMSNTTNITHGSIYDHYYKRQANETIMFFGSKIDLKNLHGPLYTSSTLFLTTIAFSCCATQ